MYFSLRKVLYVIFPQFDLLFVCCSNYTALFLQ